MLKTSCTLVIEFQTFACPLSCTYPQSCPSGNNRTDQAALAAHASADVLGEDNVETDRRAYPCSDYFSYMLVQWPGAYLFLGMDSAMCHHPTFSFDDGLLPVAASVFTRIVERRLG